MQFWLLTVAMGFALAVPLTVCSRTLARRFGQMDYPGGHKRHDRPVPVAGGVAVLWATGLPLFAAVLTSWPAAFDVAGRRAEILTLLAGALGLHVVGLIDDRKGLGAGPKLICQFLAVLPLVLAFDVRLLPTWLGPGLSIAVTMLWFLVIVNAFNFLDGLDGLLGGVASICAMLLGLTAVSTQESATATLLGLLVGALLGFLVFNLPPASIFMGDSGSLVVGFLIAYGSVTITYRRLASQPEAPWYAVLTPLVVLAIPLYDFVVVVALRLFRRRDPTRADNRHFSHRLRSYGLNDRTVLAVICCCTLATGMGGVMLVHLETWQAVLVAIQTATVLTVLALIEGALSGGRGGD